MKVDLNSDLGEGVGHDDEILSLVSSANIACGFHAGNPASIFNSIRAAKEKGVAVGAHPSLDDRKDFDEPKCRSAQRRFTRSWPIKLGHLTRCVPRPEWT